MAGPWRPVRRLGNAARIRPTIPSHDGGGKWYQRSNLLRGSGIRHPDAGYGYRGGCRGRSLRPSRGNCGERDGRGDAGTVV